MSMNKDVLAHVIAIREDVASIKEHLKTLNGKVLKPTGRD